MIVSYNKPFVGDTLLVQLTTEPIVTFDFERHGDLYMMKEAANGEVKAFNLFNASNYMNLDGVNGNVELTEAFVDDLKAAIKTCGATLDLDVDLTPKFVVGHVLEIADHPDADKLHICQVQVDEEQPLQIVCGAPNVAEGQKVVVAKIGAVMPSGTVIVESKLRGVESYGMMCSARELAIPNAPQVRGILVLDSNAEVGAAFHA
jgi:tRNA-binding protein